MFLFLKHLKSKWIKTAFRIRAFRNWYTLVFPINRFLPKDRVLKSRNGQKLYVNDVYGSAIGMTREVWEKNDYGTLPREGIIVDIGANIGAFTLLAAQRSDAHIYALEPIADVYAQLIKNVAFNHLQDRVTPQHVALAGENGERKMTHSKRNMGGNSFFVTGDRAEDVSCETLEDFMQKNNIARIDYLKCDCEGAEYEIFFNAPRETLARIDRMAIELHTLQGHTFEDMRSFLQDNGFRTEWSKTPRLLHAVRR